MRVFHLLSNGDSLGLKMKIESEGHKVDNNAPNPDCVVVGHQKYSGSTPAFNGGSWAYSINNSSDYATTVLKALGIKNGVVKNGVAITVSAWYNGSSIQGVNYSIIDYLLMEGDKGPVTAGMGTTMWIGSMQDRLYKDTIGKLQVALEKVDYQGIINIRVIVGEDKLQLYSISAGLEWNMIPVFAEMYNGKLNDLLYSIASGVDQEIRYKSSLGMGVVLKMFMPVASIKIDGLNKHNLKHFWMDDPEAQMSGRLGMITARGDNIQGFSALRDAKRRIMRTINNLTIPEVMYRVDIGNTVEKDKAQLKKWEWIS